MANDETKIGRRDIERFIEPYRVTDGKGFRLNNVSPRDTRGLKSREQAEALLERGVQALADLQEKLYAQDQWGVLLIFQAMDAAGKDGAIKHVMSGINPQGCQVYSFKAPSSEELDHDFMWRTSRALPERGRIGIFNRSYYEEVLVVRVHPALLGKQKVPAELITKDVWEERFEDITAFERYLARNGYVIRKFFLHVSKDEQKARFLSRLDEPEKNWKFSLADAQERRHWGDYMDAYEDMIRHTASTHAPWFVVPADRKWFARLVIAAAVYDALDSLSLRFPTVDDAKKQELKAARAELVGQTGAAEAETPAAEAAGKGAKKGRRKGGKKKDKKPGRKGGKKAGKEGEEQGPEQGQEPASGAA
jgi:PPK2 family polyphosphate:nucleotide phosphotransferase